MDDPPCIPERSQEATMDEATRLIESGYRTISNKHRGVARLDRPDWLEHMARHHVDGFPGDPARNLAEGMRWAKGLGKGAADHYRTCLANDKLYYLPAEVYERIRKAGAGSGWGGLDEYRDAVDPDVTVEVMARFGPRNGPLYSRCDGNGPITREEFGRTLSERGEISFYDENNENFVVRRESGR